jgi:hypothetical protein
MKKIIIFIICGFSFLANSFPIPKDGKATFDIIRKNKIIGSANTFFEKNNENLIITTIVDIKIKLLFIPAYKFYQKSIETWRDGEFIIFEGHTDFEDEREYFINGRDDEKKFTVMGMDGELKLDKNILPNNYWNKEILKEKEFFDMQKGILRKIEVKQLEDEIITINQSRIETEKYSLNASKNPKDLGPFPEYTLWYAKNGELIKFKFTNWKDKKEIITQRNNWSE